MRKQQTKAWWVLVVSSAWALPAGAQDTPEFEELAKFIRWGGVLLAAFVVLGAWLFLRLINGVAAGLGRRFSSHRLLIQKLESITQFVVYVLGSSAVLGLSVRLDSTAWAVIGGGLAFAIGFAMRDLVAAFIAGVTIMFDRPFQVGDRVNYGGEYGDIIKIGLRSVRMNTLDHNIVTIPNNKVLTDVTSSGNYGALEMQVAMDFFIGVDQNVELACELVREACVTSRFCFLDNPVPVSAKQAIFQEYVVFALKARPYVLDVKYEKAFETDVHIRVQKAFREKGIEPPAALHREIDKNMRS
jgi:small-conductance mechanosensitive channel